MFCCAEREARAESVIRTRFPSPTQGRPFRLWRQSPLPCPKRWSGLTMLEVLVALCLFSFAMFPLLDGFARASGTIGEITLRQEAAILAAANLETWASKPFADLIPGRGQPLETPQHVRGRIRQVLDVDDVWPGRLRRLTITVETIEPGGAGKHLLVLGTLRRNEHPGRGGE